MREHSGTKKEKNLEKDGAVGEVLIGVIQQETLQQSGPALTLQAEVDRL